MEEPAVAVEKTEEPAPAETSYSKLYDDLFSSGKAVNMSKPVPKPSMEAQRLEEGSRKVLFSETFAKKKRNAFFNRKYESRDVLVIALLTVMHVGCLWAPATYSPAMVALALGLYFVTGCIGITFCYHRMLSHHSFVVPKWMEYAAAYCGVMTLQGDPIEWCSTHRYHHIHTDTPLDPHSTYEGAWWSHTGWILDWGSTKTRTDEDNARDLSSQPFYRWIQKTYIWHVGLSFALLYAIGGFPALIWGGCVRTAFVWHITWAINSVCHIYGRQTYDTKDLSKNNLTMGLIGFGEGWHNNHHAFEFSARHGLKWWQLDMTWGIIRALQVVGLAKKVKLPSEQQKARLAFE